MEKIRLNEIAKPRETFLVLLVFVLVVVVFFRTFYLPRSKKMDETAEKIRISASEKKILEIGITALGKSSLRPSAEKESGNIKIDIINNRRKNKTDRFTSLIATLADPGFEKGIVFDSLAYKPPEAGNGFSRTSFNIKARGAFDRVTSFVKKLDNIPTLVDVNLISISANPMVEGDMDLEITAVYYQLEESHAKGN